MKSLLKNLGLILMIIGAAILVGVFFTGSAAINDNGVLGDCIPPRSASR